jgi:TonB family protein
MKVVKNKYFNETGCLTLDALEKYNSGKLEGNDLQTVSSHLAGCDLCSDALEGLKLINDKEKLNSLISEINDNLTKNLLHNQKDRKIRDDRVFYFSAAAVIIILFGFFSYFKFYINKFDTVISENSGDKKVEMPVPKYREKGKNEKRTIDTKTIETITTEKLQYITINLSDIEPEDMFDDELEISLNDEEPIEQNVTAKDIPDSNEGFLIDMVIINSDANVESGPSAPPAHINLNDNNPRRDKNRENSVKEFTIVEIMPQFPGGETGLRRYLQQNLKYPVKARNKGIEGKVYISFAVSETGRVTDVEVLKGIDPECNNEAVWIIKGMPEWEPGTQQGKPVSVRFVIPVYFKLN